jgi:hypothetical protein
MNSKAGKRICTKKESARSATKKKAGASVTKRARRPKVDKKRKLMNPCHRKYSAKFNYYDRARAKEIGPGQELFRRKTLVQIMINKESAAFKAEVEKQRESIK